MKKVLWLFLFAALPALGQVSNPSIIAVTGLPGSCSGNLPLWGLISGTSITLYECQSGVPTAVGGSGSFTALSGDATSTATGGATTVKGLSGVPFCNGFTPTNNQAITYTTGGTPNPCYTASTASGSPSGTQYQIITYDSSNAVKTINATDSGSPVLAQSSALQSRLGFQMPTSGWGTETIFDDSYGVGQGVASPSSTTTGGYAYQLNAAVGSPTLTNFSSGGKTACDIARSQVFPNVLNGASGVGLQLFGDGINDYFLAIADTVSNPFQYIPLTKRCWEAEAALLASNISASTFAYSGSGFTGTNWAADTTFSAVAGPAFLQTSTASATATATIPGAAVAGQSIMFFYRFYNYQAAATNSQNANFSYQLDGSNFSYNVSAVAETNLKSTVTDSIGVIFIPNVAAGAHTVTFKASTTLLGTDVISIGPVGYTPAVYATGTAWSSTGSVCTYTAANQLAAGQTFYPQSFATTTALNSSTAQTALTANSTTITANCTQAAGSGTEAFNLIYGPPIVGQPMAFTREVAYTSNDNNNGQIPFGQMNYAQIGDYYNDEMSAWVWEMQNIYGFQNIFQAKIRNFYKAGLTETSNLITQAALHPNTLGYTEIKNAYLAPLQLNRPPKINHDVARDWPSFRYLPSASSLPTSLLGWGDSGVQLSTSFGAGTLYLPDPPTDVPVYLLTTHLPGEGHTITIDNLGTTTAVTIAVLPGQASVTVSGGTCLPGQVCKCENPGQQNWKCWGLPADTTQLAPRNATTAPTIVQTDGLVDFNNASGFAATLSSTSGQLGKTWWFENIISNTAINDTIAGSNLRGGNFQNVGWSSIALAVQDGITAGNIRVYPWGWQTNFNTQAAVGSCFNAAPTGTGGMSWQGGGTSNFYKWTWTDTCTVGLNGAVTKTLTVVGGTQNPVGHMVFTGVDFTADAINVKAARKGTFVCTGAGTITITNANEALTSDVVISLNTVGGTITTPPAMSTATAATGFTVLCGATDTSTYNYDILN